MISFGLHTLHIVHYTQTCVCVRELANKTNSFFSFICLLFITRSVARARAQAYSNSPLLSSSKGRYKFKCFNRSLFVPRTYTQNKPIRQPNNTIETECEMKLNETKRDETKQQSEKNTRTQSDQNKANNFIYLPWSVLWNGIRRGKRVKEANVCGSAVASVKEKIGIQYKWRWTEAMILH